MQISSMRHGQRLKDYYTLAKPGIIRGNIITAGAGFLWASNGRVDVGLLVAMVLGLSLIIAAGSVSNNVMDRELDAKMARTRKRALVVGSISAHTAMVYASLLGLAGVATLAIYTNLLTVDLAVFGYLAYVFMYGYAKRHTVHSTIVGSISGAIPPVVGYCAVSGQLDLTALLLFLILVCWQMPHFYAIAIYRLADYRAAGIPVLPLRRGLTVTKRQIIGYIIAFTAVASGLAGLGHHHILYLASAVLLGVSWLRLGLRGFGPTGPTDEASTIRWARRMFGWSLIVITGLCLVIAVDSFLHI